MVVKKRYSFPILILAFLILMSIYVLASHVVKTSDDETFFSYNESIVNIYNISVNNTDTLETENITKVNITLPSGFTFITDSNGTSAGINTFSSGSNWLSWLNDSGDGLIMNLTWQYFWFNTTATPGEYNLTIITYNTTGWAVSSMISVTINDTTVPTAEFGTNPVNMYNSSSSSVTFDLKCTDNHNTSAIALYGNWSSGWHANYTNSSYTNNTWLNTSVTGISEGIYLWGVWCNDTSENIDWTDSNRTLVVDKTNATISFSCDESTVDVGDIITCTCSGTDALSGISSTSYTAHPSTSTAGTFTTTCAITDNAGNIVRSSLNYTVEDTYSSSSSSSSGGGATTTSQSIHTWRTIGVDDFATMTTFKKDMGLEEIKISVTSTATNAKITVNKYNSKPTSVTEKSGSVYKYLQISTTNLDNIKAAKITLKVEKSWMQSMGLKQEDIRMFKFDASATKWNELETTFLKSDDTYNYYETTVSSFSYFSIASKKVVATPTEETPSANNESADTGITGQAVDQENENGSSSGLFTFIFVISVILIIMFVIFFFTLRKKKKRKNFGY